MTQESKETSLAGKSPRGFSSESVSCASTRVWKEQSGMRSALLGTKTRTRYSDQRFSEAVVDQNTEKKMAKFRVIYRTVQTVKYQSTIVNAASPEEAKTLVIGHEDNFSWEDHDDDKCDPEEPEFYCVIDE